MHVRHVVNSTTLNGGNFARAFCKKICLVGDVLHGQRRENMMNMTMFRVVVTHGHRTTTLCQAPETMETRVTDNAALVHNIALKTQQPHGHGQGRNGTGKTEGGLGLGGG